MATTQNRIARNQALFRSLNEKINDAVSDYGRNDADFPGFVCECGRANCEEPVRLSLEQYQLVRDHPTRFFVVPGHEIEGAEKIVQRYPTYLIIEKIGDAKDLAVDTAPES